jgi:ATP-binding cassette subfamily F protein uup
VKLQEINRKIEEQKAALDEKMERWMYLEELAAKIAEQ